MHARLKLQRPTAVVGWILWLGFVTAACEPDEPTVVEPPQLEVVGSWSEARHFFLATKYAPVIYQHVSDPIYDALSKFTYDGNDYGGDNWDHVFTHPLRSYVYYAVTSTNRHYFVYYLFYHPRDWCEQGWTCDFIDDYSDAHENDMEGVLIVLDRLVTTPQFPDGKVVVMETQFHGGFRAYKNSTGCGHSYGYPYQDDFDVTADLETFNSSCVGWASNEWTGEPQPAVYIEDRGHGVLGTKDPDAPFAFPCFEYHYGGIAATPDESTSGNYCSSLISYDLKWIADIEGFGSDPNWPGLWEARLDDEDTYEEIGESPAGPFEVAVGFSFVRSGSGQDPDCGARFLGVFPAVGCASAPWGWGDPSAADPNLPPERKIWRGEWFMHGAWVMAHHFNGVQFDPYETEVSGRTDLWYYQSNIFTSECDAFEVCTDTGTWSGGGGGQLSIAQSLAASTAQGHEDLAVPPRLAPGVHWNSPAEFEDWTHAVGGQATRLDFRSEFPTEPEELAWANTDRSVRFVRLHPASAAASPEFVFDPNIHLLLAIRVRGYSNPILKVGWQRSSVQLAEFLVPVTAMWAVQLVRLDLEALQPSPGPVRLALEVSGGTVDVDFVHIGY